MSSIYGEIAHNLEKCAYPKLLTNILEESGRKSHRP